MKRIKLLRLSIRTALAAGVLTAASEAHLLAQPQSLQAAKLRGVSLAGGEFGNGNILGRDYIYPDPASLHYYVSKGFNTFRIPVVWERIQPQLGGPLSERDIEHVTALVSAAAEHDAFIILDLHNYGRRDDAVIGESDELPIRDFAHLWAILAERYGSERHVIFGLMNEPHDQDDAALVSALNAAIRSIRAVGAENLILVPGNAWSGAHRWHKNANASHMLDIVDPVGNFAFEPHQYLDENSSGTSGDCVPGSGATRLAGFTEWARDNRKRAVLGEFAGGKGPECAAEIDALLSFIESNHDVWEGWVYWAGGPWWPEENMFSIEPRDGLPEAPQIKVLMKHLPP